MRRVTSTLSGEIIGQLWGGGMGSMNFKESLTYRKTLNLSEPTLAGLVSFKLRHVGDFDGPVKLSPDSYITVTVRRGSYDRSHTYSREFLVTHFPSLKPFIRRT